MDSIRSGRALWRAWRALREAQEKWSEPQKRMRRGPGVFLGGVSSALSDLSWFVELFELQRVCKNIGGNWRDVEM